MKKRQIKKNLVKEGWNFPNKGQILQLDAALTAFMLKEIRSAK